jgi:hypothetical protein
MSNNINFFSMSVFNNSLNEFSYKHNKVFLVTILGGEIWISRSPSWNIQILFSVTSIVLKIVDQCSISSLPSYCSSISNSNITISMNEDNRISFRSRSRSYIISTITTPCNVCSIKLISSIILGKKIIEISCKCMINWVWCLIIHVHKCT